MMGSELLGAAEGDKGEAAAHGAAPCFLSREGCALIPHLARGAADEAGNVGSARKTNLLTVGHTV